MSSAEIHREPYIHLVDLSRHRSSAAASGASPTCSNDSSLTTMLVAIPTHQWLGYNWPAGIG
jgi:hypothetical protein